MFGYIVMNKPEIKFKDFDLYRSFYCGLCRELKSKYGISGQISLTYDMTFVVILLSALYESPTQKVQGIFIQCIPPGRVFRHSLQIGGYLRDIGELEDFLELLHGSKPALHCADFRGKSAVGEYASHCFSLPFLMSFSV